MSTVTVQNFAEELKRPVAELLSQLKEAGVSAENASSPLSSADKMALLGYLRQKTRSPLGTVTAVGAGTAGGAAPNRITLKRKETSEIKLGGGRGLPTKTVSVEVRKKKVFKAEPLIGQQTPQSQPAAYEEPVEPVAMAADEPVETPEIDAAGTEAAAHAAAAAARSEAEAEARRLQEEAALKLREEEAERLRAEAETAERTRREHDEKLKNDPIYRAKYEAESARRRASENVRRSAEMRNAMPPPVVAPVAAAKKPAVAAAPATDAKPDRDRDRGHRQELHVAEGKGGKRDKKKRKPTGQVRVDNAHQFEKPVAPIVREVEVPEGITVADLANRMAVKATELIKVMMKSGVMATINQMLDQDTAVLMVEELGHKAKIVKGTEFEEGLMQAVEGEKKDVPQEMRPPVVTIMGHVDHGKTSLLDYIRKTRVAAGEAGGITQHIGAYHVKTAKGVVTFLDTPGHAAFTRMRARGAQITDVVILVIAGDDGVMPQTREAINHARAAKAPMVVAVTKIDKPQSDLVRVKNELLKEEVVAEDFGGDVQVVGVSSVSGQGIDELLDAILLQAEVLELKAAIDVPARGQVVESSLDKGRGPVATVLVRAGTLRQGDVILTGPHFGRVRAMFDETGKPVKEAGPSIPVQVLGLSGVPDAGDDIVVVADERKARELGILRESKQREQKMAQSQTVRMEQIFARMGENEGDIKQLNLMIKADVQGSAEALTDALRKLPSAEVRVNVLASTIGGISESDVDLALASKAIIIGFNVRADSVARKRIQDSGIDVRYYSVIYQVIDDVTAAITGLLGTEMREQIVGIAQVRDVFRSSKFGSIAGCLVIDGTVQRNLPIRVLRNQTVIYEGVLESLRRFKDDVQKVESGTECGIGVKNYNDVKAGDQIECFDRIEVKRTVKAEA
ncbi:translation initiation factor IF-2 [Panacagrimonas perspica]|uniref:Translation initiation factor IF-2 n=1 Tax=Panacagrimonas perspica TaxID=381431 RepID=A0A4R7PE32_9GAMM|nr:translation initiation factor IF-2 [Panacagrimonas perspica]TDU32388.1 translation initiation factor IF-2 [Panacagrimonas perspica]THD05319.1 translation initiation factor IF-2 [Panacagrimonas perspica]